MNVEDVYRILRNAHVQAQGIVDTVTDPMLVLDATLRVEGVSRSYLETFNVSRYDTTGRYVYELGAGEWNIPELRRLLTAVISQDKAVINYSVDCVVPELGLRTMLLTARTIKNSDGLNRMMLLTMVDVTDAVRGARAKDVLVSELRHRMQNLLSLAQSIARQTATAGRSAEEFRDDFLGRFGALIGAQNLAFADGARVGLQELIECVLAPHAQGAQRAMVEAGPPIELHSNAVVSLSLVLHELATNAAKYGALSSPDGRLAVAWEVDASNSELRLTWSERDGPATAEPARFGFGSKLIQSTVVHGLGGRIDKTFAREGLFADIRLPLANIAK